jgi:hypothetical protein
VESLILGVRWQGFRLQYTQGAALIPVPGARSFLHAGIARALRAADPRVDPQISANIICIPPRIVAGRQIKSEVDR